MDVDARQRRLLLAVVVGGFALVAIVGVGLYGLLTGPAPADSAPPAPESPVSSVDPLPPRAPSEVGPVPSSSDPEEFSRAIAVALFTWTTVGAQPEDYAQPLIDVAADTETAALLSDILAYLPNQEAWTRLRTHQTRQWLTIDSATVPVAWPIAQNQALPGQVPDGTTAFTIEGHRQRDGIWGTQHLRTSRPVAFTVFVVCPRSSTELAAGSCRLLRLSRLDTPLR